MARFTAQEVQEKHATRLKAALPDMQKGVEKVTVSPTLKAAAKKTKMLANLTKAVQDGKWEAGLKRVTLDDWKNKMINKGIGRVSVGIDEAAPKTIAFYEKLLPFQDGIKAKIEKMPDVTLQDNINRMVTQITEMAKFKR